MEHLLLPVADPISAQRLDQSMRITLSVDEAMVALSIGRTMLYSLLADGSIASIKVGKKRLVLVSSIHEWLNDQLSYGFGQLKDN